MRDSTLRMLRLAVWSPATGVALVPVAAWSQAVVAAPATNDAARKTTMIDATYLKAHRTASSLGVKRGGAGRLIVRAKGGMNTKLHAVTDANGRPISFFMTAGQVSDYTGTAASRDSLPKARWMLVDGRYDADWFHDALQEKGITPCIPGRKIRSKTGKYDKRRYTSRNRIEIMFGRLKKVTSWTMRGIVHRSPTRRDAARSVPEGLLLFRGPRRNRHLLPLINESSCNCGCFLGPLLRHTLLVVES